MDKSSRSGAALQPSAILAGRCGLLIAPQDFKLPLCCCLSMHEHTYRFRGVSKKKGKWEAKVMVNRKWAYRELFDSEEEAARAYDDAVWRLKPKEAKSYINFKERFTGERAPGGRLHRPRQLSSLR